MVGRYIKIASGIAIGSVAIIASSSLFGANQADVGNIEIFTDVPKPSGVKWHRNWDRRAIESCVRPPRKPADFDTYEQKLTEAYPKATRNVILVRHGRYEDIKGDPPLSVLGREQAELCALRLKSLNLPITKIVYSTMKRATETGHIISQQFKGVPAEACSLLEEGAPPAAPLYPHHYNNYQPWDLFIDGQRMEAAFRKYIKRAGPKQDEDSYEILACHGNVIRYFTLRALQLPPESWISLYTHNTSITWLTIYPSGDVILQQFGDTGHLPPNKIT